MAGRPIGASNKPKRALIALLDDKFPGWHPVVQMAQVANDQDAEPRMRFDACKEVAKYIVPQLKAVELTGPDGGKVDCKVLVKFVSP